MSVVPFPTPQRCHACEHPYVGAVCPMCKEERPAFTALKAETKARGEKPITTPLPNCRYYPASLCNCALRGLCLEPA